MTQFPQINLNGTLAGILLQEGSCLAVLDRPQRHCPTPDAQARTDGGGGGRCSKILVNFLVLGRFILPGWVS
jgi:hypothetical protein